VLRYRLHDLGDAMKNHEERFLSCKWSGLDIDEVYELTQRILGFVNKTGPINYGVFAGAFWVAIEQKLKEKNK
jgi:hypothetical protein